MRITARLSACPEHLHPDPQLKILNDASSGASPVGPCGWCPNWCLCFQSTRVVRMSEGVGLGTGKSRLFLSSCFLLFVFNMSVIHVY